MKHKRALLVAAGLVLALLCGAGGTLALLSSDTAPVVNTFTPGNVDCQVDEDFDGEVKENVSVRNIGNVDSYVRVVLVINWVDDAGAVAAPGTGEGYTLSLNGTDWFQGSDGYYYCKSAVAAGANSPVLIQTCQPTAENGLHLQVQVIATAIQAAGTTEAGTPAVEAAWGVTVDGSGMLTN